jgi:signal transduction histidine kinase
MRTFRGSFTTFFIITLVAVLVLPAVMIQLVVYRATTQRLKESLDQRLSGYSRHFTEAYRQEHQKSAAVILFAKELFAQPSEGSKVKAASYFFGFGRRFFRVSLLDSLGKPLWTLVPNSDQTHLLPQPWEERSNFSGLDSTMLRLASDTAIASLGLVVVPDGYAQRVLLSLTKERFLLADIRLSDLFAEISQKCLLGGKTLLLVYGDDGTLLYHPHEVLDKETAAPLKDLTRTSDFRIGQELYRVGAYRRNGFRIVIGIEYSDMLKGIQTGLGRGLLFTILLTVLSAVLFLWAGSQLKRATDVIVKRTGEIASGDFEKKIAIPYPEDFNQLASNINELSLRLKTLTSERVQSAKLAAIGKFAAHLVHDLRSPVYGISLLTNELKKIIAPSDPLYRYFQEIALGIERLGLVVDRIADHSRIYEPAIVETDLNALIHETINEFSQSMACRLTTDLGELPHLKLDPQQWRRAFLNLFQNSYEAKKEDCEIAVAARRKEEEVVIEVRDRSGGLDPKIAESLFEPFVSTKKKGVGLGLSYVREIVEAHHGRISQENRPGEGVKFIIVIPYE